MTYRGYGGRVAAAAGVGLTTLVAVAFVASPAAADPSPGQAPNAWLADLSTVDGDDVNVVYRAGGGLTLASGAVSPASLRHAAQPEGTLLLPPHTVATPSNRVSAKVSAVGGVSVDVRGQISGGQISSGQTGGGQGAGGWTEWRPAGEALDATVNVVQVRVTLTGAASVQSVHLTADSVPAVAAATPGRVYRVYATREGLVGGTTANGHVITSRDHFVALPSRRGLAPRNTGDYSVRVCTTSGSRCEYAPVWDVGPWNTTDDYWNPSSVRQSWKDLPQGRPEAQAAYQNGYNGGRDQFGRVVANPAGIDLADGTFWDGLLLTNNAWVDVAYLWTGTGTRGKVGGGPLNVRSGPGTTYAIRGLAATHANVPIECWVTGTSVAGPYRTSTRWNRLASGQFVSHAYISAIVGTDASQC
jgi:hypothetical protein